MKTEEEIDTREKKEKRGRGREKAEKDKEEEEQGEVVKGESQSIHFPPARSRGGVKTERRGLGPSLLESVLPTLSQHLQPSKSSAYLR